MAVIKTIIRVTDALSATIVSVVSLIVLFTNTAGANEKIDDRLLLHPPLEGRRSQSSRPSGHKVCNSPTNKVPLTGGGFRGWVTHGYEKRKTFRSSFFVPPQVVLVMRCAPAQVDFCTLVWLWSSKNVASPNQ